jgi:hypothetical protein
MQAQRDPRGPRAPAPGDRAASRARAAWTTARRRTPGAAARRGSPCGRALPRRWRGPVPRRRRASPRARGQSRRSRTIDPIASSAQAISRRCAPTSNGRRPAGTRSRRSSRRAPPAPRLRRASPDRPSRPIGERWRTAIRRPFRGHPRRSLCPRCEDSCEHARETPPPNHEGARADRAGRFQLKASLWPSAPRSPGDGVRGRPSQARRTPRRCRDRRQLRKRKDPAPREVPMPPGLVGGRREPRDLGRSRESRTMT